MNFWTKRNPFKNFWDERYTCLAMYNAEKERGLLHSEEYKLRMSKLQKEYDTRLMDFAKEALKK